MKVERFLAGRSIAAVALAGLVLLSRGDRALLRMQLIPMARHHGPAVIHARRDVTTSETYNWAGYAVTGAKGSVTDVKSSWIVPAVTCTAAKADTGGYSAFWVGIDGWTSATVEQIGTDSDCVDAEGNPSAGTYYAWFEFYPRNSYYIGNPDDNFEDAVVKPGDVMAADVKSGRLAKKGPGPGGHGGQKFTVTIANLTRHWTFTTSLAVPGADQTSAEWIAETPFGCATASGFCELADFGMASYGAQYTGVPNTASVTVGGKTGPPSSFPAALQEAVMVADLPGNAVMAQPSPLTGNSFRVAWTNAGP